MITEGEGIVATEHEKILVLCGKANNRNSLNIKINELLAVASSYDAVAIKKKTSGDCTGIYNTIVNFKLTRNARG